MKLQSNMVGEVFRNFVAFFLSIFYFHDVSCSLGAFSPTPSQPEAVTGI